MVIDIEQINTEHKSWSMSVKTGDHHLEFVWGPISGFGGIDHSTKNENTFAYCDEYLDTLEDARRFLDKSLKKSNQ